MKRDRKTPEVNSGSTADMAFLLLIFYLVTTTMNVDKGILRKLPPPPKGPDEKAAIVNERNIFVVLINKDNQLAVKGEFADITELKDRVKEFISNPTDNQSLSMKVKVGEMLQEELSKPKADQDQEKINNLKKVIAELGPDFYISKGIISLQNDRGTTYGKYLEVSNEIVAAINDLRDELSKQIWGSNFDKLSEDKQDVIKFIYPYSISEAEPRSLKK